jgi:hypothetical protein
VLSVGPGRDGANGRKGLTRCDDRWQVDLPSIAPFTAIRSSPACGLTRWVGGNTVAPISGGGHRDLSVCLLGPRALTDSAWRRSLGTDLWSTHSVGRCYVTWLGQRAPETAKGACGSVRQELFAIAAYAGSTNATGQGTSLLLRLTGMTHDVAFADRYRPSFEGSLNLRAESSTKAQVIMRIYGWYLAAN